MVCLRVLPAGLNGRPTASTSPYGAMYLPNKAITHSTATMMSPTLVRHMRSATLMVPGGFLGTTSTSAAGTEADVISVVLTASSFVVSV